MQVFKHKVLAGYVRLVSRGAVYRKNFFLGWHIFAEELEMGINLSEESVKMKVEWIPSED